MSTPPAAPPVETPDRLAFYDRIGQKHLAPLWRSLARLVTPEPVSACQPAASSFADIRAIVQFLDASFAEHHDQRSCSSSHANALQSTSGRAGLSSWVRCR